MSVFFVSVDSFVRSWDTNYYSQRPSAAPLDRAGRSTGSAPAAPGWPGPADPCSGELVQERHELELGEGVDATLAGNEARPSSHAGPCHSVNSRTLRATGTASDNRP